MVYGRPMISTPVMTRVSFGSQDFGLEEVEQFRTFGDNIEVVILREAVDDIPAVGDWCVISVDDNVVANDNIRKISTNGTYVGLAVPKQE